MAKPREGVGEVQELVIQIEVANVLDDGALQEKIKKICETYKGYRIRIVVKEESASGW